MSTISSVGGAGSAWSDLSSTRASARSDRMFAKADANGDGTVDKTELQSMLDTISSKTGQSLGSADDLMSKLDADGNGSLSKDELANGMKSLMPPPSSTMDFAQQRSVDGGGGSTAANDLFGQLDTDGNGGLSASELNKLLDQIAAGSSTTGATTDTTAGTTATDPTASTGSTGSVAAAADAAVFKKLDTDGDGTISKSEFDAAASGKVEGHHHHGHLPPPTDANSSSSDSSGGTGGLDVSQGDALKRQFDAMISALESAGSSSASSSGSTSSGSDSSSSSAAQGKGLDLSALTSLVLKEYSQAASNYAQTSSVALAA